MNGKRNVAQRVAVDGLLVSLAFIFSYIETLFPLPIGVPGIKLGLANLVVLSCISYLPLAETFVILVARIVLSGFLFGNMASIIYSLAGGLLSFLVMMLMKKTNVFSIVGVSLTGGVAHNIGQLLVAMLVVSNSGLIYYLPVLILSGAVCGLLIGLIGKKCSPLLVRILR